MLLGNDMRPMQFGWDANAEIHPMETNADTRFLIMFIFRHIFP